MFRPESEIAVAAVTRALDQAHQGTGGLHFKVGRDVVTDTDIAIEDSIRGALEDALGLPVIGEERGGTIPEDSPYWLLDPICGTRNFASGIPLYTINIALVEEARISIAVVGDGSSATLLVAELGGGAYRLGDRGPEPVASSATSRVIDFGAWPAAGAARDRASRVLAGALAQDRFDIRCLSTTLSLAYVAEGRLAACVLFEAPSQVHVAAGTLVAREAGALVTEIDGTPWTLASDSLIASADESVLRDVLALIASEATAW